jgi:hypothetical protein
LPRLFTHIIQGRHVRHIEDRILTLRCPNPTCGRAFAALDNCMALRHPCGPNGGTYWFCGLCLELLQLVRRPHCYITGNTM